MVAEPVTAVAGVLGVAESSSVVAEPATTEDDSATRLPWSQHTGYRRHRLVCLEWPSRLPWSQSR